MPAQGKFDHAAGTGHVPYHAGDYVDALKNRKATVQLLVHETLGGMCPFSARRLRRLARDAATNGCDTTDYTLSSTARSFVPFYAQRISSAVSAREQEKGGAQREDRTGQHELARPR